MELLPASDPEDVVDRVRALQIRALDEDDRALRDMGLSDPEDAKAVLRRIFDRLKALRQENKALRAVQDAVGVESPDDVVDAVESLLEQADAYQDYREVLREAGFERPEFALEAINSMEEQLDQLYNEKAATERTEPGAGLDEEGDTFDQLQALLAREEKLQRELGVSNPNAVVEMVEGLQDQLEDLYRDRDDDIDSIFAPAAPSSETGQVLEEEFGVSDPEAAAMMLNDLTDQLDELYTGRERLAELNLNGADDAIQMVRSMQSQLESLYERQEQMSEHGIDGIDYALSVIENMEAQLGELYEERQDAAETNGVPSLEEATLRLEEMEQKLASLTEEKERLQETRDRLQAQIDDLEAELGTGDPEAISGLVQSLEEQLQEVYEERERLASQPSFDEEALLAEGTLAQLDEMDPEALNDLPVGVFGLDPHGVVERANERALHWPDVVAETPDALLGRSFFDEIAPGTDNTLFRGQFEDGVEAGAIDEAFRYTYVGERPSLTNLAVHLYSESDQSSYWVVFQVLDRY